MDDNLLIAAKKGPQGQDYWNVKRIYEMFPLLLPLKQRTAVVLHYYEDLSLEAIATAMGTSVGTAKAHLSRGRDRLRELLEESA